MIATLSVISTVWLPHNTAFGRDLKSGATELKVLTEQDTLRHIKISTFMFSGLVNET